MSCHPPPPCPPPLPAGCAPGTPVSPPRRPPARPVQAVQGGATRPWACPLRQGPHDCGASQADAAPACCRAPGVCVCGPGAVLPPQAVCCATAGGCRRRAASSSRAQMPSPTRAGLGVPPSMPSRWFGETTTVVFNLCRPRFLIAPHERRGLAWSGAGKASWGRRVMGPLVGVSLRREQCTGGVSELQGSTYRVPHTGEGRLP